MYAIIFLEKGIINEKGALLFLATQLTRDDVKG